MSSSGIGSSLAVCSCACLSPECLLTLLAASRESHEESPPGRPVWGRVWACDLLGKGQA